MNMNTMNFELICTELPQRNSLESVLGFVTQDLLECLSDSTYTVLIKKDEGSSEKKLRYRLEVFLDADAGPAHAIESELRFLLGRTEYHTVLTAV